MAFSIHILETAAELQPLEDLQRKVWPGSEIEITPMHILKAVVQAGGLIIGAFENRQEKETLVGFVLGFPGLYETPDGPRLRHYSHMLAVDPAYRNQGIGFSLKRAQWQMVRRQGVDRITWTYDPLLSRNAHLNITLLGGVVSTYLPDFYGPLRDELNAGLATDRFEVDWWVNSLRVSRRLSKRPRGHFSLPEALAAGAALLNPADFRGQWPEPAANLAPLPAGQAFCLVEIPADFQALRSAEPQLAQAWRHHSRHLFQNVFETGYLITDLIFQAGNPSRSYYLLSHGDSTL